ncbi:maleylacetoacetate isomerase [Paremcibacter congregatus]|uniref:maleylacetoacetate isomerase n=1 Tax=Paremcibacter congregatus TaxID=2043170 RepID=UPI0030EF2944|tara:strand:- start:5192 stop:5827 length:636 start_codon:yes stop_codon:yes gene_type:complete
MELYGYFRSSAAYRVRAALHLKGLDYVSLPVSLLAGDHKGDAYLKLNPQGFVPFLRDDDKAFGQSLAMLEYLEENYPQAPLLPGDSAGRARVRQMAGIIACDIHPLDNLRVLKYLTQTLGVTEEQKTAWYHHWIIEGFTALETLLSDPATGDFCHGDSPTFADLCLVPQVYNARRFNCPLDGFPHILRIVDNCNKLDAFIAALPENQPDAT